jgi:hypothetical protein
MLISSRRSPKVISVSARRRQCRTTRNRRASVEFGRS